MSREWQQTRFRELVMPDAVYYQSIWAVRDLERMEKRLALLRNGSAVMLDREGVMSQEEWERQEERKLCAKFPVSESVASYAENGEQLHEVHVLEQRTRAIREALAGVPPMYRTFLLDNIILKKSESCFPNKLWRVWKQRFLYNVAKNLELI